MKEVWLSGMCINVIQLGIKERLHTFDYSVLTPLGVQNQVRQPVKIQNEVFSHVGKESVHIGLSWTSWRF